MRASPRRPVPPILGLAMRSGSARNGWRGVALARWLAVALATGIAACGAGDPGAPETLLRIEEPRFVLEVDEAAPRRGDGRQLRVRVVPHGAWHLSTEYPVRLETQAVGLRLARARWTREEAATLSEQALEFQVAFSDAPGALRRVEGALRFGVCREAELCEPVDQAFDLRVP